MTEPRWTYVTPADGPSTKLHLPGCRMMTETEKLGRVHTVEGFEDRDPMTLGDLLCKHCQKRVDPLPKIKERLAKVNPAAWRYDTMRVNRTSWPDDQTFIVHAAEDMAWLVAEVERFRSSG